MPKAKAKSKRKPMLKKSKLGRVIAKSMLLKSPPTKAKLDSILKSK